MIMEAIDLQWIPHLASIYGLGVSVGPHLGKTLELRPEQHAAPRASTPPSRQLAQRSAPFSAPLRG